MIFLELETQACEIIGPRAGLGEIQQLLPLRHDVMFVDVLHVLKRREEKVWMDAYLKRCVLCYAGSSLHRNLRVFECCMLRNTNKGPKAHRFLLDNQSHFCCHREATYSGKCIQYIKQT